MTRAEYMNAAAAALTETVGVNFSAEQAEALLGDVWDAAQAECANQKQFSRVMMNACGNVAVLIRDMST